MNNYVFIPSVNPDGLISSAMLGYYIDMSYYLIHTTRLPHAPVCAIGFDLIARQI